MQFIFGVCDGMYLSLAEFLIESILKYMEMIIIRSLVSYELHRLHS